MRRIPGFKSVGLLAAAGLLVTACAGAASPTPTTQASQPAATSGADGSAGAGASASALPGTKEFSVAFTSIGMSSAPFLAALEDLRGQGYTIETPELAESELVTQGVASGEFAFGSGANNSTMTAVEAGANLKLVVSRVNNEWTIYARNDIEECADLDGRRLAIHSEGAVSTAMVRNWIETNCPGTEPQYVVIAGSPNRLAALLADEIDASPLELTDAVTVDLEASDRFGLLASLAQDVPDLQTTSVYVNGDFAEENPGTVVAVVKALLEQFRQIEGNPEYLQQVAEERAGEALDAEAIGPATERYVELDMFPTDGGLTEENLQFTAEFFGPEGAAATQRVLEVDEFADLSYLQMALDELGSQ